MADQSKWQCRDCGSEYFCIQDITVNKCASCGSRNMKEVPKAPGDPEIEELKKVTDKLLETLKTDPDKVPQSLRIELCAKKIACELADTARAMGLAPSDAVQIAARVVGTVDAAMQNMMDEYIKTEGIEKVANDLIKSLDRKDHD